jgi:hypothetical protein
LLARHAAINREGSLMISGGENKGGMTSTELLGRVHAKLAEVERYVQVNARRRRLLVNLAVIASGVAAFLTAPFAAGGKQFAGWLQEDVLHTSSPSWQLLCLLATVCSVTCVIATQIQKSHSYDEHIVRAQELRATLEALELSITSESLTPRRATGEFMKCIESGSFMEPTR